MQSTTETAAEAEAEALKLHFMSRH